MAPRPRQTEEAEQPTFVFKGTIKKLKSATMKQVPVDDRTAVVTVDQIIEAPPDLAGYSGQDITVQLSDRPKLRVGQQMIFHTTGWMFGDGVAVRSLKQEPVTSSRAALGAGDDEPVKRRAQRVQGRHFDSADLVVFGKVVAVRLPSDLVRGRKQARAKPPGPISEHDPKWNEAVIEVDQVLKGSLDKKKVVVRFPASSDVMWHGAPKFHAGQEGCFMLHQAEAKKSLTKSSKGQKRKVRDAKAAESYLALDPADFQPYNEPGGIKTILESDLLSPMTSSPSGLVS